MRGKDAFSSPKTTCEIADFLWLYWEVDAYQSVLLFAICSNSPQNIYFSILQFSFHFDLMIGF